MVCGKRDHEPIRVGPAAVACLANEPLADRFRRLLASVKRDMHAAPAHLARFGHVGKPGVGEAQRIRVATGKLTLVERDDAPLGRRGGGCQGAVDVLEQPSGGVEIAIVDERWPGSRRRPCPRRR